MFESFGAGGFTVIILVVLLGMLNPFSKTLWQLVQLQTRSLHSSLLQLMHQGSSH